jgi:S-formylglutathione hydrolase FrmB
VIRSALLTLAVFLVIPAGACAAGPRGDELARLNERIGGRVLDYTANHGADRRIFSPALRQRRDLYVYLPPNFDPAQRYPVMIYLHGVLQDERGFLRYVVKPLDEAILSGRLPPLIVAAPDGSLRGEPTRYAPGSFFINGPGGAFQDWIVHDVWDFLTAHFPIRPEAEAHILAGVSMGGFGAYNIAIKYPDRFRIVIGVLPALNIRWIDCRGHYMTNFDPRVWAWRNSANDPREVVGSFFHGFVRLTVAELLYPAFGRGPAGIALASAENPIEMIDRYGITEGQLDMFVGYAGRDEFNLDAQAESFLYLLQARGITATVYYDPHGTHSEDTATKMIPAVIDWLAARLRAYRVDVPCPVAD